MNPFSDSNFRKRSESDEITPPTPEQAKAQEIKVKYYKALKNSLETARASGRAEREQEIAEKALVKGYTILEIMELTGLSRDKVEKLLK